MKPWHVVGIVVGAQVVLVGGLFLSAPLLLPALNHCVDGEGVAADGPEDAAVVYLEALAEGDEDMMACMGGSANFHDAPMSVFELEQAEDDGALRTEVVEQAGSMYLVEVEAAGRTVVVSMARTLYRPQFSWNATEYYQARLHSAEST